MYDDILLPVAPGSAANDAVPHARSLAERYDATVHVVSAVDTLEHTLSGPRVASLADRVEAGAERRVETVTTELEEAGIDVVGNVIHGDPLQVIKNAIEDTGADIVVMPTHTRTGLQRVLLGSVTEKIVRVSPVPVVTVPMADRET
ncbi:nucleotide-binding universal stress UspA family protein [Halorubrum alkaliphilum]|uniref:Nucleotide-binding universal stress UspA family protein n=1 Tax=Halorubrum alkaliphilum TaxID=261290 RepID=A0A8T4G9G9_9EURY|nr:universal stress protein [Halorubrum alkaliphilum]MBP1921054.1 nucleotide-binding universal stress UspA family protein [Halorubrum alkaliphilum]